jgi:hypothetical protein
MTAPSLLALQRRQQQLDLRSPPDFASQSPTEQLKTLTLQLGVVNMQFMLSARTPQRQPASIRKAFQVALRMANLMNVDLDQRLRALPVQQATTGPTHPFVQITGRMAKAMEATDHFENYPSRAEMEKETVQLAAACLSLACSRGIKLDRLRAS